MNGLIHDNSVVVKPGKIPQFYNSMSGNIPEKITQYDRYYTYAYVHGYQATVNHGKWILEVCQEDVWECWDFHGEVDQKSKEIYMLHVVSNFGSYPVPEVLNDALGIIHRATLPVAFNVHGDMTLENIVIHERCNGERDLIFIDPGEPRGISTPALDRGKLLQSIVMRWEEREKQPWTYPFPTMGSWPVWADVVDWAFLVTHWSRLMRHWPDLNIFAGFKVLKGLKPNV